MSFSLVSDSGPARYAGALVLTAAAYYGAGRIGLELAYLDGAVAALWPPAGLGLAWTFQFYTSLSFFIGAVIAWAWKRRNVAQSEEFLFPPGTGVIAGGALIGVVIIFWENGREMIGQSSTSPGC